MCRSEFKTCYTDSDNMVNYDLLHGDYERDGGPDIVTSVHYDSHSIQPACVKESQHGSRSRCTDMCSHGCVGCVILSILKLFLTDTFVE